AERPAQLDGVELALGVVPGTVDLVLAGKRRRDPPVRGGEGGGGLLPVALAEGAVGEDRVAEEEGDPVRGLAAEELLAGLRLARPERPAGQLEALADDPGTRLLGDGGDERARRALIAGRGQRAGQQQGQGGVLRAGVVGRAQVLDRQRRKPLPE